MSLMGRRRTGLWWYGGRLDSLTYGLHVIIISVRDTDFIDSKMSATYILSLSSHLLAFHVHTTLIGFLYKEVIHPKTD